MYARAIVKKVIVYAIVKHVCPIFLILLDFIYFLSLARVRPTHK